MPNGPAVSGLQRPVFPTWDGATLPVIMLRFDDSQFDPAVYEGHGIARPPAIAASVVRRQAEYFYGRLAASMALDLLGVDKRDIGNGAWREPLWPDGVIGSISHSAGLAAAVVADRESNRGCGIGIDIESIAGIADEAALDGVMSAREHDRLRELGGGWPHQALARLVFSAKESFFKASFATVGRHFDFDAIELVRGDMDRRVLAFRITAGLAPALPAGALREVHFAAVGDAAIFTSCSLPPG